MVSLDWKWLFVYPDEHVGALNELTVPAATPLEFELTSGTVMNAFFIPQLGSQIYTMAGMTTHLNLMAAGPGEYWGGTRTRAGRVCGLARAYPRDGARARHRCLSSPGGRRRHGAGAILWQR